MGFASGSNSSDPQEGRLGEEVSMGYCFGLRGSREAAVLAEALEAKALMCLRRLTRPSGSDPTVL